MPIFSEGGRCSATHSEIEGARDWWVLVLGVVFEVIEGMEAIGCWWGMMNWGVSKRMLIWFGGGIW